MEEYLSEKEQWEQIKAWLRDNGLWIIVGVLVGAAVLGGMRWRQDHLDDLGVQASNRYNQIVEALSQNDRAKAFVLIGAMERDFPSSPYLDQAKLLASRIYVETDELDKAAGELQSIAEHTQDSNLALIAKLRLARVQIAQKKPDLALTTLNGMKAGAFEPRYHEVLGDAYFAKGDKATALKEYLKAKVGDFTGTADSPQLELKISDLSADSPPPVAQTTPAPAANPAAK